MQPERPRYRVAAKAIAAASVLVLTGCSVNTSELLTLRIIDAGADVDINCSNGGCEGSDRVAAEISLEESYQIPTDAVFTLNHYTIDYDLGAPQLSAPTSVVVEWGQTVPFSPRASGEEQRAWAANEFGTTEHAGLATITVTGVDHDNGPVTVSASFEVVFGDFLGSSSVSSGAGASGSTSSGSGGAGGAGGN